MSNYRYYIYPNEQKLSPTQEPEIDNRSIHRMFNVWRSYSDSINTCKKIFALWKTPCIEYEKLSDEYVSEEYTSDEYLSDGYSSDEYSSDDGYSSDECIVEDTEALKLQALKILIESHKTLVDILGKIVEGVEDNRRERSTSRYNGRSRTECSRSRCCRSRCCSSPSRSESSRSINDLEKTISTGINAAINGFIKNFSGPK